MMLDLNMSGQKVCGLVGASLFEQNFDNKLRNMGFKLY